MIYTSIELSKYKPFKFSNIHHLKMTTASPIQIIIGANGSGKSSLLREISPLPSTRTSYDAIGYKRLKIVHGGIEYEILSDFANKTSPHSFKRNGEELNEGGTTAVQEDLVRTYLGYTKQTEAIITGKHSFCTLPPGLRRNLIMEISPFNLGFILDHHKSVMAALRACKNNLTMLHERKSALEAEMVAEAEARALQDERKQIDAELTKIIEFIHRIDEALSQLTQHEQFTTELTVSKKDMLNLLKQSVAWRDVNRDDPASQLEQLMSDRQHLAGALPHLEDQIISLAEEIDGYQAKLGELSDKVDKGFLENEIATLKTDIEKLSKMTIADPFPEYVMQKAQMAIEQLGELCDTFLGCSVQLIGSRAIRRKEFYRDLRMQQLTMIEREIRGCEERESQLAAQMRIVPDDLPKTNCAKSGCPLYVVFMQKAERTSTELATVEKRKEKLIRKAQRISLYVNGITDQLQQVATHVPNLTRLASLIRDNSYFNEIIGGYDLLQTLMRNPTLIATELRQHYLRSEATYSKRKLERTLEEKSVALERVMSTEAGEGDLIRELLERKTVQLEKIRDKHRHLTAQIVAIDQAGTRVRDYQTTIAKLTSLQTHADDVLAAETVKYEQRILTEIREILIEAKSAHVARIGVIDNSFRTQEILKGRYDQEVLEQIKKIEAERAELSAMEAALSPKDGIPHTYTVAFLNAVIDTANAYIAAVFSYNLELDQIDGKKPIDYTFGVQVGDVHVDDISTCSSAQQEMMNLAFNLAFMKHCGLSDYPIFLDEAGKSFDHYHRHELLNLFQIILDEGVVSSLYLVNHNGTVIGGLSNADIFVINELNIVLPSQYNDHVEINASV